MQKRNASDDSHRNKVTMASRHMLPGLEVSHGPYRCAYYMCETQGGRDVNIEDTVDVIFASCAVDLATFSNRDPLPHLAQSFQKPSEPRVASWALCPAP